MADRRRRCLAAAALLAALGASGCDRRAAQGERPSPVVLLEEWRVGDADGSGPLAFASVEALALDGEGRLHVLDGLAARVRVIGPAGRFAFAYGRSGEGPGELAGPAGLASDGRGRMWVYDPRANRYAVFDAGGAHVADYRRPASGFSRPWFGGFGGDGCLYDLEIRAGPEGTELEVLRIAVPARGSGRRRGPLADDRAAADGECTVAEGQLRVIARYPLPRREPERFVVYETVEGRRRRVSVAVPFAPVLAHSLTRRGTVWTAATEAYRLEERTLAGETVRIVSRRWEPAPVREAQRRAALQRLREATGPDLSFDGDRIPDRHPALEAFFEDEERRLWVLPVRPDGRRAWDLFDPAGRWRGEVGGGVVPLSEPRPATRGGSLWAVVPDPLDVPRIARLRLRD